MKKGTFEIIILVIGVLVLSVTLYLMFSGQLEGAKSMYWTNIAIAGGFVVYIVNNWMNTNALNKEIRELTKHNEGLKQEVKKLKSQVAELQEETKALQESLTISNNEKEGLNRQLLEAQEELKKLQAEENKPSKNDSEPE